MPLLAEIEQIFFVTPLTVHVTCTDLLLFSDDVKTGATPTLATWGFESAYLLFGNRYLPEAASLAISAETYMSSVLLSKQTLLKCPSTDTSQWTLLPSLPSTAEKASLSPLLSTNH